MSGNSRRIGNLAARITLLGCTVAMPTLCSAISGTITFTGMIVEPPYDVRVAPVAATTVRGTGAPMTGIAFETSSAQHPHASVQVEALNNTTIATRLGGKLVDLRKPMPIDGSRMGSHEGMLTLASTGKSAAAVVTVSYQ